ncbi:helix-turn-helix transcriptional regulator [Actinoplanes derwentensis]|nr:helix-turn-helix transcriptional regulator [Actinoplanes derwentensis]
MRNEVSAEGSAFATLLRDARRNRGETQDDVILATGVSRSTYLRWEAGGVDSPNLKQVRDVCRFLGIHPGHAGIALGLMSREDLGLSPEPFDPVVVKAGTILADENQPARARAALRKALQAALDMWRAAADLPEPKEPRGADLMPRRRNIR